MGAVGAQQAFGSTRIISSEEFKEATRGDTTAEVRSKLARIMYPAKEGTVLQVSDNYSLTKMGNEPGAVWKASDGMSFFGDDAVKFLANNSKSKLPTAKQIDSMGFKNAGGGQYTLDIDGVGGASILDETGSSRSLRAGFMPNQKVYQPTVWDRNYKQETLGMFTSLAEAKKAAKEALVRYRGK